MTQDFWNQIKPQLHIFVSDQISGYTALELYESLSVRKWWTEQPIDKLYLTYDSLTLPIESWLVACRGAKDDRAEELLAETLKNLIHDVVTYEWAMRQIDLEAEYQEEVKEVA